MASMSDNSAPELSNIADALGKLFEVSRTLLLLPSYCFKPVLSDSSNS